jgi:NAD(P)-dependent dehydrogenase (short-subunit alcohol dehydrogenase family)
LLGSFFAEQLLKLRCNLILIDINSNKLDILKIKLKKKYLKSNIITSCLDISNEVKILELFKNIKKKNYFVDVLINNATIDSKPNSNKKNNKYLNISDWENEIRVGITGTYIMIKIFGEEMYKSHKGSIINIGSDLSVISPDQRVYQKDYKNFHKPASYSVIKHSLVGMTKYFSVLYASRNVKCNMMSPGPILKHQKYNLKKELIFRTPMRRLCNLEDLSTTLIYLIDKKTKFVTGQNILIDGGRTLI